VSKVDKVQSIRERDPLITLLLEAIEQEHINLLLLSECQRDFADALLSLLQELDRSWQIVKHTQYLYVFTTIPNVVKKRRFWQNSQSCQNFTRLSQSQKEKIPLGIGSFKESD
jgi:hypothetical protein